MSVLGKTVKEEAPKANWKKFMLPGYIVFSLLFIAYSLYSYFGGVVFQSGQQQGYTIAVQDLAKQVTEKCEPVSINVGGEQIDVINVACLQQAPAEQTAAPVPTVEGQ